MKLISMRSVVGEAPAIVAELSDGEIAAEGTSVEGGSGRVVMVSPGSCAIRAVEMFSARPKDLPAELPFEPESLGYVLARRIRDGLKKLVIDAPGGG